MSFGKKKLTIRANRYSHHFKWNDFGKNPMFRAPILSIFPDDKSSQSGIATGKCTAYHGCKERDYQFVPRWKMRNSKGLKTMSMGQDLMSKETPRDLNSLLDRTMFRKYPMSVLENWIAADESDYELLTEPKQMTFEFDVADFTECHHTQWSSNNMVFKRGTESSVDMSVEDVTITSFSRSGVQGTFVVVVFLENFHRIPQKIQRVSTHSYLHHTLQVSRVSLSNILNPHASRSNTGTCPNHHYCTYLFFHTFLQHQSLRRTRMQHQHETQVRN